MCYIQMHLGPQKLDYSISVPMTIIYCALWLFGMAGMFKTERKCDIKS